MKPAAVIIPAHNEERVIEATLHAVARSSIFDELDVVVVSNGSSDRTAEIVTAFRPSVRLIETDVASKSHALVLGMEQTDSPVRIVLDADIVISADAIESVMATMAQDGVHGSAPRCVLANPAGATKPLKAYAGVWRHAPYFHRDLIGSGFFAVSEDVLARIGHWPDLIADDLVALCHVAPSERRTAPAGEFVHTLPRSLKDVLGAEIRREAGRQQFAEWAAVEGKAVAEEEPGGRWLVDVARDPRQWPGIVAFVAVKVVAKNRARRQLQSGSLTWSSPERVA